jgi:hypothetical protein
MALIWSWLLGLASVVTGEFSPVEVVLTIAIGLASLIGLVASPRVRVSGGFAVRAGAFLATAVLQIGAMWISLQSPFATR